MIAARCEVCGNAYDKPMEIRLGGGIHVFDSFECAIDALAPRCAHCGCRVIGHGTESRGATYGSAHCAHAEGIAAACDRV